MDITALERQLKEKQAIFDKLKAEDEQIAKVMIETDKAKVQQAKREAKERGRRDWEIDQYRARYQTPQQTSTWDINDPKYVLKCDPLRKEDQTHIPPSSMLRFDGELQKGAHVEYLSNQDGDYKPVASWKGFTHARWKEYRRQQAEQMKLKLRCEENQRQSDLKIELEIIDRSLAEYKKDLERQRKWRRELRRMEDFNIQLEGQHYATQDRINKEIYDANVISEEFFDQFGTTSR